MPPTIGQKGRETHRLRSLRGPTCRCRHEASQPDSTRSAEVLFFLLVRPVRLSNDQRSAVGVVSPSAATQRIFRPAVAAQAVQVRRGARAATGGLKISWTKPLEVWQDNCPMCIERSRPVFVLGGGYGRLWPRPRRPTTSRFGRLAIILPNPTTLGRYRRNGFWTFHISHHLEGGALPRGVPGAAHGPGAASTPARDSTLHLPA